MAFNAHRSYRIPTSSFSHIYTMHERAMRGVFLAYTVFSLTYGPKRHSSNVHTPDGSSISLHRFFADFILVSVQVRRLCTPIRQAAHWIS